MACHAIRLIQQRVGNRDVAARHTCRHCGKVALQVVTGKMSTALHTEMSLSNLTVHNPPAFRPKQLQLGCQNEDQQPQRVASKGQEPSRECCRTADIEST